MQILYKIKLDFTNRTVNNIIHIMQYDNSKAYIHADMLNDWQPCVLSDFASVSLRIRKPNGNVILYNSLDNPDYFTIENTSVKVLVTSDMTDAYGSASCVIGFHDEDGNLVQSSKFFLAIEQNPVQQGESSTNVPMNVEQEITKLKNKINSITGFEVDNTSRVFVDLEDNVDFRIGDNITTLTIGIASSDYPPLSFISQVTFGTGSTISLVHGLDFKFIGQNCEDGMFYPLANTKYSILFVNMQQTVGTQPLLTAIVRRI